MSIMSTQQSTCFCCLDDLSYGLNTLGPLCLWQCFLHYSQELERWEWWYCVQLGFPFLPPSPYVTSLSKGTHRKSLIWKSPISISFTYNFGVCKGYKERNQFKRKYWKPFGIFVYRWNWLIHLELSTSGLLRRWTVFQKNQQSSCFDPGWNEESQCNGQHTNTRKKNIQP